MRQPPQRITAIALAALVFALAGDRASGEPRVFTSTQGNEIIAEIVKVTGDKVTVRRTDKRMFTTSISKFSKADQEFILEWQKEASADLIPRFEIDVSNGKNNRLSGAGDYDNRTEKFEFKVSVRNESRFKVEKAKGTLLVLGRSVTDSSELKVLSKDTFEFTIDQGETAVFKAKELANEYDNNDTAQFGHKYNGYILVIQNAKGKVVASKGIPTSIARHAERAIDLSANQVCDRDLSPET